jgi:ribosome biogenesis protein ENP2
MHCCKSFCLIPDIQRRIELLQDFEMPTVSNCIKMTPDNRYMFASGKTMAGARNFDG